MPASALRLEPEWSFVNKPDGTIDTITYAERSYCIATGELVKESRAMYLNQAGVSATGETGQTS